MPAITLPGQHLALAYDDRGTGLPVVLLHAFPLDRRMWAPQAGLADQFRVLTPDYPGFGESPPPAVPVGIDAYAGVLDAFLTAIGVPGPVVVGGLSMGGYAAFAFARKFPHRLRGLILADTKPEADDAAGRAGRDKTLAGLDALGADGLIKQMLPKMLSEQTRTTKPEVVAEVERIGASQPLAGVKAGVIALRDRPDSTPQLNAIRVPTLVLVGKHDAVTPADGAKKTAAKIHGAAVVVLPGAGHLANLEDPTGFTNAVRAFLTGLATA